MFTADHFSDDFYKNSLYGVIMQVYARSEALGSTTPSFMWSNASDTFVDVFRRAGRRTVHWMSESGQLEFYLLSAKSPKAVAVN